MSQQLLYGVKSPELFSFDNFYVHSNNALPIQALKASLKGQGDWFYFLWGARSTGRSHLLQAICHLATTQHLQSSYLPLDSIKQYGTVLLDNLESFDVICIDDIDAIVGHADWEESLFHLYNRVQVTKTKLYVSASSPPRQLPIALPDLHSRLSAGVCFHLTTPTDQEKIDILRCRAKARHMRIQDGVLHYLLNQYARDLNTLCAFLVTLDERSLETGRPITIPFVRNQLTS